MIANFAFKCLNSYTYILVSFYISASCPFSWLYAVREYMYIPKKLHTWKVKNKKCTKTTSAVKFLHSYTYIYTPLSIWNFPRNSFSWLYAVHDLYVVSPMLVRFVTDILWRLPVCWFRLFSRPPGPVRVAAAQRSWGWLSSHLHLLPPDGTQRRPKPFPETPIRTQSWPPLALGCSSWGSLQLKKSSSTKHHTETCVWEIQNNCRLLLFSMFLWFIYLSRT